MKKAKLYKVEKLNKKLEKEIEKNLREFKI